jgi:hypothetical protein
MPVKGCVFEEHVFAWMSVFQANGSEDKSQDDPANNYVQGMQTGHEIIKEEKKL